MDRIARGVGIDGIAGCGKPDRHGHSCINLRLPSLPQMVVQLLSTLGPCGRCNQNCAVSGHPCLLRSLQGLVNKIRE
jgi:hypothetical protein